MAYADPVKARAYQKQWVAANRDKMRAAGARHRATHRDASRAASRRWYRENKAKALKQSRASYEKNKERRLARQTELGQQLKLETLTHYGKGGLLQCCWDGCQETDIDCLTLDHIENNGYQDRGKGIRGSKTLYRKLNKEGFPEGFQTLCGSHQLKKELIQRRNK